MPRVANVLFPADYSVLMKRSPLIWLTEGLEN